MKKKLYSKLWPRKIPKLLNYQSNTKKKLKLSKRKYPILIEISNFYKALQKVDSKRMVLLKRKIVTINRISPKVIFYLIDCSMDKPWSMNTKRSIIWWALSKVRHTKRFQEQSYFTDSIHKILLISINISTKSRICSWLLETQQIFLVLSQHQKCSSSTSNHPQLFRSSFHSLRVMKSQLIPSHTKKTMQSHWLMMTTSWLWEILKSGSEQEKS